MKVEDVRFLDLDCFSENDGNLVPIELEKKIPFDVKRIFYVFGVKDKQIRGKHAHHQTQQVLICVSGECVVICKDGKSEKKVNLDSPTKALYIPEMIWDEQIYMTDNTVLLVLSSTEYSKKDYIEDYQKFQNLKG